MMQARQPRRGILSSALDHTLSRRPAARVSRSARWSKAEGGFLGAITLAEALAAATPGAFLPRQFANDENSEAHLQTTGPERPRDTTTRGGSRWLKCDIGATSSREWRALAVSHVSGNNGWLHAH
jgi:hypothetical protein